MAFPLRRIINFGFGGQPIVLGLGFGGFSALSESTQVMSLNGSGEVRFLTTLAPAGGREHSFVEGVAAGPEGRTAVLTTDESGVITPGDIDIAVNVAVLDSQGRLVWRRQVGARALDLNAISATDVTFDTGGNVIVSSGIGSFARFAKFNANGALVFEQAGDFDDGTRNLCVRADRSGNLAVGTARNVASGFFGGNDFRFFVRKTNPGGSQIFEAERGESFFGSVALAFDNSGNLFAGPGFAISTLTKYSPGGGVVWSLEVGATGFLFNGIDTDSQGNVWVAAQGVLRKYSPTGNLLATINHADAATAIRLCCRGSSLIAAVLGGAGTITSYRLVDPDRHLYSVSWQRGDFQRPIQDLAHRRLPPPA